MNEESKIFKEILEFRKGLEKKISLLLERVKPLQDELANLNKLEKESLVKLRVVCPHTNFEREHEYIEGSYYDRSQSITRLVCTVCHKTLKMSTQYGYYS